MGFLWGLLLSKKREKNANESKLGSVAGPAIQANGSLSFEAMRTLELVQPFFYLIWILKFLGVFLLVM